MTFNRIYARNYYPKNIGTYLNFISCIRCLANVVRLGKMLTCWRFFNSI